jgi:hypothetical protein
LASLEMCFIEFWGAKNYLFLKLTANAAFS